MMRLPDELMQLLKESGVPWRIEDGTRHIKVFVRDRLTAVFPHSTHARKQAYRSHKNALANVRRAIKKL
jgi:hypothetical protein